MGSSGKPYINFLALESHPKVRKARKSKVVKLGYGFRKVMKYKALKVGQVA
jgi:hypothetical protein